MKKIAVLFLLLLINILVYSQENKNDIQNFAIAIHGGAGNIVKKNISDDEEKAYRQKLQEALDAGYSVLAHNGSSTNAVVEAIKVLENSPLFNAGKGSVFSHAGKVEMDASIMEGKELNAGAVSGVSLTKNPIELARLIMNKSPHVMLSGTGADEFAKKNKLEMANQQYFFSPKRLEQLKRVIKAEENLKGVNEEGFLFDPNINTDEKYGTVGAVALDKNGNIAAATSTGGMTNKKYGRIGDSPVIGSGTYANNKTCGVSCTGHGEYFIRKVVAHDLSAMMEYKGMSLKDAANHIIHKKMVEFGGKGGLIALDKKGNVVMPFNTQGMYRAYKKSNGESTIQIFQE